MLDKIELASYISTKYQQAKEYSISPIKLQKSLYYLYAYWAGNVANIIANQKNASDSDGVCECGFDLQTDLFNPNFEAWQYGPVDREIYTKFKSNQLYEVTDLTISDEKTKGIIISFIDSILAQTFEISDFALVDMTHEDHAWKDTYEKHSDGTGCIEKGLIIDEYQARSANRAS